MHHGQCRPASSLLSHLRPSAGVFTWYAVGVIITSQSCACPGPETKKKLKKQKSSPVPMRSSAVLQAIVNTKCMIVGQFLIKYDEATPVWAKCTGGTAWLVPWWMHSSSRPSPSSGCWRLTQWPGQLYGSGVNSVNTEHLLLHGTTARAVRG